MAGKEHEADTNFTKQDPRLILVWPVPGAGAFQLYSGDLSAIIEEAGAVALEKRWRRGGY